MQFNAQYSMKVVPQKASNPPEPMPSSPKSSRREALVGAYNFLVPPLVAQNFKDAFFLISVIQLIP